ncbi:hypothetical protein T484DRAFT_1825784 [Baffinella frigidus]|nr:hypothetical protein T484DRAFT_1825784 [Cryptophyta sp. CCMP2293]
MGFARNRGQVQVPHFGYSDEYEVEGVINLRKRLLPLAEGYLAHKKGLLA